jgi:NAD(P)-dependent dehydrogenase (short-subunit alcohol dehydrogenase family)
MSEPSRDLIGKVAIVTGATRGIGLETAHVLAGAGARVVIADLPGTPLEEAAARVADAGEVAHHPVDIADESSVQALIAFTAETLGGLHVLVNNAARQGIPEDADVRSQSVDVWDGIFAVNARGTMLMCKHALGPMIDGGGGSIVNIASGTARAGHLHFTAYACTKAVIQTLTKYVATQYGADGIRCNAVAPGLIATEALREGMPQPLQDAVLASKLVGRLGKPRDIAETVRFLASDSSAFITGEILAVDGGFYAHVPSLDAERRALAALGG